jgi:NADPH-dependent 2,4-dienoyl-CoA reductase/sulfur reductase-like enzyme
MSRSIIIIGGGPAAVAAALAAKKTDAAASVTLVTSEACEPYEKPPLSKAVLLGKAKPEDAPIAGPNGLQKHGVIVELNCHCTAIDRRGRRVITTGQEFPYDTLVIATGSKVRELRMLPHGAPAVHYLRTEAHARLIGQKLAPGRRLVVVGGGLIGLEVAASAAELGVAVSVVDVASRLMERVCDEQTSALIQREHERHGVTFVLGTRLTRASRGNTDEITLESDSGARLEADIVLVGIGVRPDDEIAVDAGLQVKDGVIVDAQCRTSDPDIFAAGDVSRFATPGGHARLENWRHAQEHGAVAGSNAAGGSKSYSAVPSFWSEQYGFYIQGVGWPDTGATLVRRRLAQDRTLVVGVRAGCITNALGINVQRDLAAVRRLIERKIPIDISRVADPTWSFADMLKVKVS